MNLVLGGSSLPEFTEVGTDILRLLNPEVPMTLQRAQPILCVSHAANGKACEWQGCTSCKHSRAVGDVE